jgi:hypothetical protein
VAAVQYSTHLHKNSKQNAEVGAHLAIKKKKKLGSKLGSAGRAPSLRVIPWHLLTTEEKAHKNLS